MSYCGKDEFASAFGHVCRGTNAKIENSPVNITLNITLNIHQNAELTDGQGKQTELGRTLSFLKNLLSGGNNREFGNGQSLEILEGRIGQIDHSERRQEI